MTDALEVLTIRDVAEVLKVGTKTVYTMAQTGRLHAFKVGGQWRFRRADIDRWIQAQVDERSRPGRQNLSSPRRGAQVDADEGEDR